MIQLGTGVLKGINATVGEELSYLADKQDYDNFVDLYIDIINHTSIGKSVIVKLIKLGVFMEFGSVSDLLDIVDITTKLMSRSTIRKAEAEKSEWFTVEDVRMFAEKETAKMFRNIDMQGLARRIAKTKTSQTNQHRDNVNTLMAEAELVGIPLTTLISDYQNTKFKDSLALVYKIKTPKWNNGDKIVSLFRLGSGDYETVWVNMSSDDIQFDIGDVIVTKHKKEEKTRYGEIRTRLVSYSVVRQKGGK